MTLRSRWVDFLRDLCDCLIKSFNQKENLLFYKTFYREIRLNTTFICVYV